MGHSLPEDTLVMVPLLSQPPFINQLLQKAQLKVPGDVSSLALLWAPPPQLKKIPELIPDL